MKIREKGPSDHEIADEIGQRRELKNAQATAVMIAEIMAMSQLSG